MPNFSDGAASESDSVVTNAGRRLTRLYILALSTVALLSLGAQWLIQWQLGAGESDSRVINVAGRQRMLSQRLAKAALRIDSRDLTMSAFADDPHTQEELSETLGEWSDSHLALQHGDKSVGLPGNSSAEIERLFAKIEPHYNLMREAAEELIGDSDTLARSAAVATIQEHEREFLSGMDAIVTQFVAEAERRVSQLRRLEYAILALTLLVLLAEGLIVFRPAVNRIERTVERLASLSQRLQAAKEQAERASTAKTRFLANVSHELRTPMTAVLGMTELARGTDDSVERDNYLAIVEEAGECLLGLLNDLIDIARIDADRLTLKIDTFDPLSPVSRTIRLMSRAAEDNQITLQSIEPEVPPPLLLGDQERLVQVLLNLTSNAIKATARGGVEIRCSGTPIDTHSFRLTYEVIDSGIGIAEVDRERIFETFTQVETADGSRSGGAGLGLAICRRIIDAMGGEIQLKSELNHGTRVTFAVTLPIAPAKVIRSPSQNPSSPSRPLNLLVVEDTEVNQVLLRKSLEKAGHRVTLTDDGESACEAYMLDRFDAVIIDLQLPGIDGAETANHLRKISLAAGEGPPPMVCLTAYAEPTIASSHALTFDAYLTKPIRREVLLATLDDFTFQAAGIRRIEDIDPDLLAELTEVFLATAPALIHELKVAVDAGDRGKTGVLSHKLLGQLPYFDAAELLNSVQKLESAASRHDTELSVLPADIWSEFDDLLSKLRASASMPSKN
ncbi:Sensory/regulatory protein RpfC [Botrimarina colliarenosi]|uniref:histidine kinase n=1 Tax=Botrimarina colliarenosi TaxID=2528001 RepID=A0A5C6AET4_9BACT|nr:Sensory/regulatory protein RpfC [Botrimarina colliarenosi]